LDAVARLPGQEAAEDVGELNHDPETIDPETIQVAYQAALNSAVRCLGLREHGRRELERKLRRKGHAAELIDRVFDYLVEHDLQSDQRFVESFIRSRIRKGHGPVKIRQELGSRGLTERDLEAYLTEPAEYWLEIAADVRERKFGEVPADRDAWAVQARFLARRGFPSDIIYRVLGSQND